MNPMITACPTCGDEGFESDHNYCSHCATDLRPYRLVCGGCEAAFLPAVEITYCPYCASPEVKPAETF